MLPFPLTKGEAEELVLRKASFLTSRHWAPGGTGHLFENHPVFHLGSESTKRNLKVHPWYVVQTVRYQPACAFSASSAIMHLASMLHHLLPFRVSNKIANQKQIHNPTD
jgi:hypothetical protein